MMRRRMMGPSLIGAAATTAVVVGTAGAVRGHQEAKQEQAAAQQQAAQQQAAPPAAAAAPAPAPEPVAPPAPAAAPAPSANDGIVEQLKQLAGLNTSGVLTDAEFVASTHKLLGV